MKKVTRFETEDGEIFQTATQAAHHEALLRLEDWYENNKLYGGFEGCRIEWRALLEWLEEHRDEVVEILNLKIIK